MDAADDSLAGQRLEDAQDAFATHDEGSRSFDQGSVYDEFDYRDEDSSQGSDSPHPSSRQESITRSEAGNGIFYKIHEMILGDILGGIGGLSIVS